MAKVLKNPRGAIGITFVAIVTISALFADEIAPYDPFNTYAGPALTPPTERNILGTDNLGRDLWSGILHGARTSMAVVFWVVLISAVIGITLGIIAGYRGGVVDDLLMRLAELFQVVPRFFLALLMIAYFGPGLDRLIVLLGLTSWPFLSRVVRIETIRLKQHEFVQASRALGASPLRIVGRHLMPNLLPPIIIVLALFGSRVIMIEAGLSFLGLGDPSKISWGFMANNAQEFLRLAWWMAVFPGLAIVMAVLGLNLLSDAINDSLSPRRQ